MTEIDFTDLHALVIEDDPTSRELVASMLESIGFNYIDRAANGEEGFRWLMLSTADIVISDLMMEPLDGISFTRQVRTHKSSPNHHTPVILLTAHTDSTTVIEARDAGVNAFIAKPVLIKEMRRKIALALNDPRQFIRSEDYVGPDRRRRDLPLGSLSDRRSKES